MNTVWGGGGGVWWRRNIKLSASFFFLFYCGTIEQHCWSGQAALWSTFSIPKVQSHGGHVSPQASIRSRFASLQHIFSPFLTPEKWFQRDPVSRASFFFLFPPQGHDNKALWALWWFVLVCKGAKRRNKNFVCCCGPVIIVSVCFWRHRVKLSTSDLEIPKRQTKGVWKLENLQRFFFFLNHGLKKHLMPTWRSLWAWPLNEQAEVFHRPRITTRYILYSEPTKIKQQKRHITFNK